MSVSDMFLSIVSSGWHCCSLLPSL